MNKLYLTFIFTFVSLFMFSQSGKTVVDYYKEFAKADKENKYFTSYNLTEKNGKWIVSDNIEYGLIKDAIIDNKNYYIKIIYSGGDGVSEHTFAVFLKPKGDTVIAASAFTNGTGILYETYFYQYDKGNFNLIKDKNILPEIDYTMFYKSNQVLSKIETIKGKYANDKAVNVEKYFQYNYIIPREGTTIKVKLAFNEYSIMNIDKADNDYLKVFSKSFDYDVVEILWIYKEGKFIPGKKITLN